MNHRPQCHLLETITERGALPIKECTVYMIVNAHFDMWPYGFYVFQKQLDIQSPIYIKIGYIQWYSQQVMIYF